MPQTNNTKTTKVEERQAEPQREEKSSKSVEKLFKKGFVKMFSLEYIAFPLAVLSIMFTFTFNMLYILAAAKWLIISAYFISFGLAISALIMSLIVACSKNKVAFVPSMVVAILAVFAIIV